MSAALISYPPQDSPGLPRDGRTRGRQGPPTSTTSEENVLQASLWWHLPNCSLFSGNSTLCQVDSTVARMDGKAKHGGYAFPPIPRAAHVSWSRDQHSLLGHHSSPNSRTERSHRVCVCNCPAAAPLPQASLLDFFVNFSVMFLCKNRCLHRYFSTTNLLCKHTRSSRCNAQHQKRRERVCFMQEGGTGFTFS